MPAVTKAAIDQACGIGRPVAIGASAALLAAVLALNLSLDRTVQFMVTFALT